MRENRGMAELTLIDPPADAAVGARRAEVLARLREAEGPLSVQQVALQTGLHVNTARFHLAGWSATGWPSALRRRASCPDAHGSCTPHAPRPTARAATCLLYTSPSPRDGLLSRMPS